MAVYHYANVPAEIYQKLVAADSMGRYFGEHIRNEFPLVRAC